MPRRLSFLLLNLFACYVASSSPPETLYPPSNTTRLLPNAQATCSGFKLFQLRPLYGDCTRAVDDLSSSRVPDYFHSGSPIDVFQLPVTEAVGTCELLVQLAPLSLPDFSSWHEVKAVARQLNEHCRVRKALSDVTGGTITAGIHDRIQISMVRRKGDVREVVNG